MKIAFFLAVPLLLLAACSPVEQVRTSALAKPEIHADKFQTETGHLLPLRSWFPKHRPKAVLVAVHGFNDYSRAFEIPARFLSAQGLAVYAYDQRGFGANPQAGIWAGDDSLVADLKAFVRAVNKRHRGVPVYLLGESMGGAVVIAALTEPDMPPVAGVVLSAPAVWGEEAMPLLYRGMLWAMVHIVPAYKLTGENLRIRATSNIDVLRQMSLDPLVIKATRVDSVYGLVGLMDRAARTAPEAKGRMLVLYGARDKVIPPPALQALLPKLTGRAIFSCYEQGYHMLLRDVDGKIVLRDIASWMLHKNKPLPSGGEDILEHCQLV